ncbi:Proliferation-associated nucleolar protein (NOL1) [Pseudoloma neurophilia]|uniref:Proliferation-associated nucleolar protein (NOL1) n=1 Tax=Pseudoloma neurophilia TaxID=146866 RepID=A0A0R0LVN3_9MICR|nr:Proliferation-associated nucleolar protein (NOL1) [Pseudoloma neurophilia]
MYKKQADKLRQILVHRKPLSFFKKDRDYLILKKVVENREQIAHIIELNGLKDKDRLFLIIKIYQEYLMKEKNTGPYGRLIIRKKYVRMNTLAPSLPNKENNTENDNFLPENQALNKTQIQMIQNYGLKETGLPFLYELPLNRSIKLSVQRQYIIQNLPTVLPPLLLNPQMHSTVIDACAAPGNKTSHLAAIMRNTGKIYAYERDEYRFNTLKENLDACHVKNTVCLNENFLNNKMPAEYILLDPSCTGSGIHLNYKENEKNTASFHVEQVCLLKKALRNESAKRVVYSTCSIHEKENEEVVASVIRHFYKEWRLEKIETDFGRKGSKKYEFHENVLYFDRGETIGFFCAVFVRKKHFGSTDTE